MSRFIAESIALKSTAILSFQVLLGVIAAALSIVFGGSGHHDPLTVAFSIAGIVATAFAIDAMAEGEMVDLAIAISSLTAALAVLCVLIAAPFFAAASALVSIVMASLAARLARYHWIVGEEHFLLTVLRALPVVSLFAPLVDLAVREKAR